MDLGKLAPCLGAGMRVAEPVRQRMVSRVTPTPTDTAAGTAWAAGGGGPGARRAGFTIMELMIVLVIIGIMAMTVAPSLSEVLTSNRQSSAAMDLVRFGRRVRSRAVSSGAAQLARFVKRDSNGLGRVELFTGINNKCMQTPWADAIAAGAVRSQSFDMTDYNTGEDPKVDDEGRAVIELMARATDPLD